MIKITLLVLTTTEFFYEMSNFSDSTFDLAKNRNKAGKHIHDCIGEQEFASQT